MVLDMMLHFRALKCASATQPPRSSKTGIYPRVSVCELTLRQLKITNIVQMNSKPCLLILEVSGTCIDAARVIGIGHDNRTGKEC